MKNSINPTTSDIAVIGMGCYFPEADTPEKFWENLKQGKDLIRDIPPERMTDHCFDQVKSRRGSFLEEPYHFDADFFRITPEEAVFLDPQHRLLLELAIKASFDSGSADLDGKRIGVFIGSNQRPYGEMIGSEYYRMMTIRAIHKSGVLESLEGQALESIRNLLDEIGRQLPTHPNMLVGNINNMLASRISHELNLTGPSMTIDSACSSSLVAIHLACESLLSQESEMALAGGINLNLNPQIFRYLELAGAMSPTGQSRPFSADADGMVLGEGAGMVYLKKASLAMKDGNPILAVIRASGVNNDGRSMGVMAPNPKGQLALLERIYKRSGIDPKEISYLEAHGTGTRIGDGLEINTIRSFFGPSSSLLSIGSVKSNIGHLLAAAGIAGFLKVVLSLVNRQLPPTLHADEDNSRWQLGKSNIRIQTSLSPWDSEFPRTAGINSFGFGGTNCHLIVGEAPVLEPAGKPSQNTPAHSFRRKSFYYPFFPEIREKASYLHEIIWNEVDQPFQADQVKPGSLSGILLDSAGIETFPASGVSVEDQGAPWIHVYHGSDFIRKGEKEFIINQFDTNHFQWLFDLADPMKMPLHIHAAAPDFRILRSLVKGLKATGRQNPICVLTANGFDARSPEIDPDSHSLAIASAGFLEESPEYRGGLIDIDPGENEPGVAGREIGEAIASQLFHGSGEPWICRKNRYYLPAISSVSIPSGDESDNLYRDGVFLVAGGSSGIGMEIAKYLCRHNAQRIFITGTRELPEFSNSDELAPDLLNKLTYIQSDIVSFEEVNQTITQIYREAGQLTGVYFAPGKITYGSFLQTSAGSAEMVRNPKITGIQNLARALEGHEYQFVILISSISGISPGFSKGMTDYAAANAYLDAYASDLRMRGKNWMSVAWTAWSNTGMSRGIMPDVNNSGDKLRPVIPVQACRLLDAILELKKSCVVVMDSSDRPKFSFTYQSEQTEPVLPRKHPVQPESRAGIESSVKEYLKNKVLQASGLPADQVHENDSFQMLGIDSLAALDIIREIEEDTGTELNPTLLFEHDTLHRLGEYLETKLGSSLKSASDQGNSDIGYIGLLPSQMTFFTNQVFYPDQPCNMFARLDLSENLEFDQLTASFLKVISRHPALGARFEMGSKGPLQQVVKIDHFDLTIRNLTSGETGAELEKLQNELLNQVISMEEAPLIRALVVNTESGSCSLMVSMHHIIADALSLGILIKEVLSDYAGIPLSEWHEPWNYEGYVKGRLTDEEPPEQTTVHFWENELNEMPGAMNLPYTRIGSDAKGQSRIEARESPGDLLAELISFSDIQGTSLVQTLLASFFGLLARICNQENLLIRVAVAHRDRRKSGMDSVAGCLADSIPVTMTIGPGEEISSLIKRLRQKMFRYHRHAHISAIDFARLAQSRRDSGPTGISPVGFSYIELDNLLESGGMVPENILLGSALPFTDLSLIAVRYKTKLYLSWIYRGNQFAARTIRDIANEFVGELQRITGSAPSNIRDNLVLPEVKLPGTRLYPEAVLIHDKLFRAFDQYSGRIAVEEAGNIYTYSDLKKRVTCLTNSLRTAVLEKGTRIGILAYPGMEGVTGVISIIASGAAYVPFDPDWPDGRIERIIRHSGIRLLLCSGSQYSRIRDLGAVKELPSEVLVLSPEPPEGSGIIKEEIPYRWNLEPDDLLSLPTLNINEDDPIHVMYTSGTSGNPKGVVVSHGAVSIFLDWIAGEFSIGAEDRFIQTSSLGFGGSIRQMYSTLLAGGTMVPVPRISMKDPEAMLDFLIDKRITILNTVSTLLTKILEEVLRRDAEKQSATLDSLRLLLIGGEMLPAETVRKWIDRFGETPKIVNLYGSTETVVNATVYWCVSRPSDEAQSIPVGRPRDGSQVILVNESGRICRGQEEGEILVGGPSIAQGYLDDPEMTRMRFIKIGPSESVFYKTGDFGKIGADGLLYFLGRNDEQIQLYGNRIELTEIESTIHNSGWVRSAAVIAHDEEGNTRILAFIEPKRDSAGNIQEMVRDYIAAHLPVYMIPHLIEMVDAMPLNQAGKTDKMALRESFGRRSGNKGSNNRLTATESLVMDIWKDVLKTDTISVTDDFFRLGGDSILTLDIIFRLRHRFSNLPPAPVIYLKRTIRALSEELDRLNPEGERKADVKSINPKTAPVLLPLSDAQKGFILAQKVNPATSPNWCSLLPVHGSLDASLVNQAFNRIILRHPMLRTIFVQQGYQTYQKRIEPDPYELSVIDLSNMSREAQELHLAGYFESLRTKIIDFAKWPLLFADLFRTGENEFYLAISIHHAIGDAWSLTILCNEFLRFYDSLIQRIPFKFSELRSTYDDYVRYAGQASTVMDEESRNFWLEKGKTFKPSGRLLPVTSVNEAGEISQDHYLDLPNKDYRHISSLAKEYNTSPFILFLTVWSRVVRQLAGQNRFIMGTALSGRDYPVDDIQLLVGCFARGLPLPIELNGGTFREDLKNSENSFSESYYHSGLSPKEVLECLQSGSKPVTYSVMPCFFSFMDFSSIESYTSPYLKPDWQNARFHFNSGSMETELMLGVVVRDQLRINLYGTANNAVKHRALELMKSELDQLISPMEAKTEAQLDSALIAYWPSADSIRRMLLAAPVPRKMQERISDQIAEARKSGLVEILTTRFGRSGIIMIPSDAGQIGQIPAEQLKLEITDAILIAAKHGAGSVSLAGNLPSLTNYCFGILDHPNLIGNERKIPSITSGHAATVVAVVKNIQKALIETGMDLSKICLGIVGFGSIGQSALSLLLRTSGDPASVCITDLESQMPRLERTLAHMKVALKCPVKFFPLVKERFPDQLYDSRLIIGASTGRVKIEVDRLLPGTIIVDDSFPTIIPVNEAVARMKSIRDILTIGGGMMNPGDCSREIVGYSRAIGWLEGILKHLGGDGIPGCRLESMLSSQNPDLPLIHGLVNEKDLMHYWQHCNDLGLNAVPFHLEGYRVNEKHMIKMREIITSLHLNPTSNEPD